MNRCCRCFLRKLSLYFILSSISLALEPETVGLERQNLVYFQLGTVTSPCQGVGIYQVTVFIYILAVMPNQLLSIFKLLGKLNLQPCKEFCGQKFCQILSSNDKNCVFYKSSPLLGAFFGLISAVIFKCTPKTDPSFPKFILSQVPVHFKIGSLSGSQ